MPSVCHVLTRIGLTTSGKFRSDHDPSMLFEEAAQFINVVLVGARQRDVIHLEVIYGYCCCNFELVHLVGKLDILCLADPPVAYTILEVDDILRLLEMITLYGKLRRFSLNGQGYPRA